MSRQSAAAISIHSEAYLQERAAAAERANSRNELFMQAAEAYINGNSAKAAKLAAAGKEANKDMRDAHWHASLEIFRTRYVSIA
jgi:hypothetical protein